MVNCREECRIAWVIPALQRGNYRLTEYFYLVIRPRATYYILSCGMWGV